MYNFLTDVLGENNKGLEDRRDVEHESGVVPEGLNVALIAGIEEDRPILSVDKNDLGFYLISTKKVLK